MLITHKARFVTLPSVLASVEALYKSLGRYRDTGLVSALSHGGGQKSKLNPLQIEVLRQIVIDNNDATLEELCELLSAKAQIKISRSTMDRLLQKLQLTRKKKRSTRTNKTATE